LPTLRWIAPANADPDQPRGSCHTQAIAFPVALHHRGIRRDRGHGASLIRFRSPPPSSHTASMGKGSGGNPIGHTSGGIVLQTPRLILIPLRRLDEAEHVEASGDPADAVRDTRAAEAQWREHDFGPWAIRDRRDNRFLGGAELRIAGQGIEGIAPDEVEAGWWVTEDRRNEGIATEAMQAAIDDLFGRADVESISAYIEDGGNEPSRRLAAKLGFAARGPGRGRSGEPMTVYELRRDIWRPHGAVVGREQTAEPS